MRWSLPLLSIPRAAILPLSWSAAFIVALAFAYAPQQWPLVDLYEFFEVAQGLDWSETFVNAFGRGREYRPAHVLLVKLLVQLGGVHLWFYKTLDLLLFMGILTALVWLLRPTGWSRSVAVLVALCCVVGLHTTTILLGLLPGHSYALVTVLVLTTGGLALEPRMRARGWVFLPLTLIPLLLWELGILTLAVVTMLWLVRAPGVSRTGVAASWLGALIYATIRLSFGNQVDALQYTESGLGFAEASRAQLGEWFANAPYLFAIYNVAASALTVLFSEPRAGKFKFVESLLHGNTPVWLWLHLISSTLTTMVVASLIVLRKRCASRELHLVVLGLTLMAGGSALGFLYTRDRISVLVGLGYALLLCVALSALWERVRRRRWGPVLMGAIVVALVSVWTIRDVETWLRKRDAAWETYVEWTDRWEELGAGRRQTPLLRQFRASALANVPDNPREDPAWTYDLFERGTARP